MNVNQNTPTTAMSASSYVYMQFTTAGVPYIYPYMTFNFKVRR